MTPTRLQDLRIEELSGVDSPANMLDGWLVLKRRQSLDDDPSTDDDAYEEQLTPEGAQVVLKALREGRVTPEDVLTPDELAKARRMQPRPFLSAFGNVRPPGRG